MKKALNFLINYLAQILIVITIIPLAIVFKQSFIKLMPCLVTVAVMYLDSKFNRYARIVGACNCVVYSIGYYTDGLYGSVLSTLFYSAPLQIVTFILWNKNKYKQGTKVKLLNNKNRFFAFLGIIVIAFVYIIIFSNFQTANYTFLQGIQFSLGLAATVLIMFGVLEGMFINTISIVLNFVQYLMMVLSGQFNQSTYLVMAVYSTYCLIVGTINWIKLYKEQQAEKVGNTTQIESN